ncbi:MAG TPA: LysR family transcriptional regulator [Clostridiales bacterium]|nr:LysR family transcriptional regulator [Clostridiales bacterium]
MFHNMLYAYEVYKERSFSKAAENLYITQPSLSAAIKKIEERIGSPIFDRSTTPISLTECGKEYIKAVEKIMDIQSGFERYLGDFIDLKTGTLSIGASNFFTSFILPPIITAFQKKHPLVKINLVEADTYHLERQLEAGTLDLIVDNFDFEEGVYEKRYFYSERLLLAVPASFPVNGEAEPYRLSLEDILAERHLNPDFSAVPLSLFQEVPFVLLRPGNDTRRRANLIFAKSGITPRIVLELDQLATTFHVSCCGMGATVISDSLAREIKPSKEVAYYKLEGPNVQRNVHFYYRHNKYVTRAMEEFMSIAMQQGNG